MSRNCFSLSFSSAIAFDSASVRSATCCSTEASVSCRRASACRRRFSSRENRNAVTRQDREGDEHTHTRSPLPLHTVFLHVAVGERPDRLRTVAQPEQSATETRPRLRAHPLLDHGETRRASVLSRRQHEIATADRRSADRDRNGRISGSVLWQLRFSTAGKPRRSRHRWKARRTRRRMRVTTHAARVPGAALGLDARDWFGVRRHWNRQLASSDSVGCEPRKSLERSAAGARRSARRSGLDFGLQKADCRLIYNGLLQIVV